MDCSSGSVSNLQRKLYWGYARAAAAIDRMQEEFIVSPMSASGRRDVYPSDIHQLWKDLNAAKAQAVPEWKDYTVESPRTDGRYQIFANGEQFAADWESPYGFSSAEDGAALIQELITHWSVLGGDPVIEAQEPAPLKLGDLVEPIDHRYTLASGCERYPYAYVVNTNPFQLMSEEGDMYWCCTVEAGGYKLIKSNDQLPEAVSLRMIREGLLAPVEAQEQSHENG
ncbi:hypothetical protein HLH16_00945 [Acinetobacter sp. ANC 5378]|nr:hypothetical protein [Acinetobacter sp. ANC 5378]